jgi:hypothetical protein
MIEMAERRCGSAILDVAARRTRIEDKIGIIAAPPNDETIGIGAQVNRCSNVLLLHTTDGAPRNGYDSGVLGSARRPTMPRPDGTSWRPP